MLAPHLHMHFPIITSVECFITTQGQLLVNKRSEYKEKFPGFLSIPGGHIEVGENPLGTAIREVKEETDVTITENEVTLKYIAIHEHIDRKETWLIFGFLVRLEAKVPLKNSREGESLWAEINAVKSAEKVFQPVSYYLDHTLDKDSGILYTNIQWENARLKKVISASKDKSW